MSHAKAEAKYWMKFFTKAGIPQSISTDYVMKFIDHRIQKSILGELTRDVLVEMDIKAMGDVIAILKHAKRISLEVDREKRVKTSTSNDVIIENDDVTTNNDDDNKKQEAKKPAAAPPVTTNKNEKLTTSGKKIRKKIITMKKPPQPSTKMTTTTTNNKTSAVVVSDSKEEKARGHQVVVVSSLTNKQQQLRHHHEPDDVIVVKETMTSPDQESVFSRLGDDKKMTSSTTPASCDVFTRLGDPPQIVTSTTFDDDNDDVIIEEMEVDEAEAVTSSTTMMTSQQQRGRRHPNPQIVVTLGGSRGDVIKKKSAVVHAASGATKKAKNPTKQRHSDVTSSSDVIKYTSLRSDVIEEENSNVKNRIGRNKRSSDIGAKMEAPPKKRRSFPADGGGVFSRLGKQQNGDGRMIASMDLVTSSIRSRLGPAKKPVTSQQRKSAGAEQKGESRISKLLKGGRVKIKKNSVFDRLGGK